MKSAAMLDDRSLSASVWGQFILSSEMDLSFGDFARFPRKAHNFPGLSSGSRHD